MTAQTTREGMAASMADLQSFRQAGRRYSGHPEHGWSTGVETTTGPLGQGVATSVGMAIAQAWLAAADDRPGFKLFGHRVFALAGDGDMTEGLGAGAASLAGHLKLGRLCWIYDCNQIGIEGPTAITFTENVGARFTACGWQVLQVTHASDIEATAHDEPLRALEARGAKQSYGFDPHAAFAAPEGVREHFRSQFGPRGASAHEAWRARLADYRVQYPELAAQIDQMQQRGAYVLADAKDGRSDVLLRASGSEVALCIAAYERLKLDGVKARVVSMPSWDLLERQDTAHREQVLPEAVQAPVSVEAASALGWDRYVGRHGAILAMRTCGQSAPGPEVQAHFGFDVGHVLAAARERLAWPVGRHVR